MHSESEKWDSAAVIQKFNCTGVVAADARSRNCCSKLDSEMKKAVCNCVDNDCLVTSKELKERIQSTYSLSVLTSISLHNQESLFNTCCT